MIPALITLAVLTALYFFMIWPAKATEEMKAPYVGRNFAHRGFYENDGPAPENSLAAFEAAMRNGYGCELDVQFTRDKKLIVFHDNDFKRACGVDANVWDLDWDQVKELKLFGSEETVPTFRQVLDTVAGRNPLIVEVKAEGLDMDWYAQVCEATKAELENYEGEYCMESFHPGVVRWVKKNMPGVTRGLLIEGKAEKNNPHKAITDLLSILLGDCVCRPHFIAYNCHKRNFALRLAQKLGAFTVMWTCRTPEFQAELEEKEDCVIFEHYHPDPRFAPKLPR